MLNFRLFILVDLIADVRSIIINRKILASLKNIQKLGEYKTPRLGNSIFLSLGISSMKLKTRKPYPFAIVQKILYKFKIIIVTRYSKIHTGLATISKIDKIPATPLQIKFNSTYIIAIGENMKMRKFRSSSLKFTDRSHRDKMIMNMNMLTDIKMKDGVKAINN